MKMQTLALAAALAPVLAFAQQPPTRTTDGVLTDGTGMTLYTSDADGANTSRCLAECARLWVPLEAPANAKPWADYTAFARPEGSYQWAFKGKPLYRYAQDKAAGDRGGDGQAGVWRVARP